MVGGFPSNPSSFERASAQHRPLEVDPFVDTREFQLLLSCAKSRPPAGPIQDLVKEGIDWPTVLKLAEQHGVRPMLFQNLKSVCWDAVPDPTKFELARFSRATAKKNLALTEELLRLVSAFQQSDIRVAALDGPILAEALYGDVSLRELCDLNIMVPEAELCKAGDILVACGHYGALRDREHRFPFFYPGQYVFRHAHTGIAVHLCSRLSNKNMALPLQGWEIWARLRHVTINSRPLPTLAQDDLALFLAGQGMKEGWRKLIWVCDFAELLRKYRNINWTAVLERTERANSSRSLLLGSFLAHLLLDASSPLGLINKARDDSAVQILAKEIQSRMRGNPPAEELDEFLNDLTIDKSRYKFLPLATLLRTRTAQIVSRWLSLNRASA
jgi:hypothetical protein